MGSFLGWDSPFMDFLEKITDIIILSLLWIIGCIPIFTMGASTSAIYYVMINKVNKKDIYVFKSFFSSFKNNFKQTILLDVILKFILGIILFNIYIVAGYLNVSDMLKIILFGVQFILLIELIFISVYLYALIGKVEIKSKKALKLAFLLSHKHMFTTISIILLGVLLVAVFYMYGDGLYLIIAPGIYFFISSFLLVRVFRKYSSGFEKQQNAYVIED